MTDKTVDRIGGDAKRSNELVALFSHLFLQEIDSKLDRHFSEVEIPESRTWSEDDLVKPLFP